MDNNFYKNVREVIYMYKLCDKCGFMYEDNGGCCPNCKSGLTEQTENTTNDNADLFAIPSNPTDNEPSPLSIDGVKNIVNDKVKPILNEKVFPFIKKHKKILIIFACVLLAVIMLTIVISSIIKNSPVKLDIDSNISTEIYTDSEIELFNEENYDDVYYYGDYSDTTSFVNFPYGAGLIVHGYNNAGYIDTYDLYNVFNWNTIIEDVNEDLQNKKKINGYWTPSFYDLFSYEESLQINLTEASAEMNGKLKNGDVIEIEYSFSQYNYTEEINCESCSGTISYTVEGLEDVQLFNPFDYVSFVQTGANSNGVAKLIVSEDLNEDVPDLDGFKVVYYDDDTIALEQNDYIIGKIYFHFDNNNDEYHNEFSNGDTVNMYCSSIENLTENYGIYISSYSKEYTFDTLGDYITKSSTITQTDIDSFKSHADSYINERYGDSDYYSNIKLNSVYIVDPKDRTVSNDMYNNLCLIYSYTYTGWMSSEGETQYMYLKYEDLIADKDGNITQSPEDYYDNFNSGYDSIDELIDYIYGDEYNTVKIQ